MLAPVQIVDLNICNDISHTIVVPAVAVHTARLIDYEGFGDTMPPRSIPRTLRGAGSTGGAVRSRLIAMFALKLC